MIYDLRIKNKKFYRTIRGCNGYFGSVTKWTGGGR